MNRVSHRELRNHSAEVLRRVEAGESLVITNHGVDVAQITPLTGDPIEEALRAGMGRRATAPVSDALSVVPTTGNLTSAEILKDIRRKW